MLLNYPIDLDYFDKIDNMIWEYVLDRQKINVPKISEQILTLKAKFTDEIILNKSITPMAVMLQERISQLKLLLDRKQNKNDTDDLTKLCFACSFDTSWLEEETKKSQLKKEVKAFV